MIRKGTMTLEQLKAVETELKTQDFKSRLNCFNDHKGLRKGELHTIIGPKGGGKSTFVRTILSELLDIRKRVYCFLSEEDPNKYVFPIYRTIANITHDIDLTNRQIDLIDFESQLDLEAELKNAEKYFKRMRSLIFEKIYDVMIFDNFTTSFMGRLPIDKQAWCIEQLKEIAVEFSMPVILVLHTAKGTDINKQLIDGDDVRGNATSVNIGSYNYLIATYFRLKEPKAFVITDKARYHKEANKRVYRLEYDRVSEIFTGDKKTTYDEIIETIKLVNLKQTKKGY